MSEDPPHLESLLARLGAAVLAVQTAERMLRFSLTFVIQRQELTIESLESQERDEAKRTIGYFLSELRKRVSVAEEFDQVLKRFLDLRNTLVHDLSRAPGWGLDQEHFETSAAFLDEVMTVAWQVTQVFRGLACVWQDQTGIQTQFDQDETLKEIDRRYAPIISQIFAEKS